MTEHYHVLPEEPICPGCGAKPSWHYDQWTFNHAESCQAQHICSLKGCETDAWRRVETGKGIIYLCHTHHIVLSREWTDWRIEPPCTHENVPIEEISVGQRDVNFYGDVFMCARCGRFYRAPSEDEDEESFADLGSTRTAEQLEAMEEGDAIEWLFIATRAYAVAVVYNDHIQGFGARQEGDFVDASDACDHWHDELVRAGAHLVARDLRKERE